VRVAGDANGDEQVILVGRISGLYGVHGWVRVYSYTEPREEILRYAPWHLRQEGCWLPWALRQGRLQGKGIVAALEGIDDRDTAARWIGCDIAIWREQLPALKAGEYYWADLVGLDVFTEQGMLLGQIKRLFETGANDVLVVQGERERLIPFLPGAVVKEVDLQQGTLTVAWDPDF
jgi:16S rRNA processing protein RimM